MAGETVGHRLLAGASRPYTTEEARGRTHRDAFDALRTSGAPLDRRHGRRL